MISLESLNFSDKEDIPRNPDVGISSAIESDVVSGLNIDKARSFREECIGITVDSVFVGSDPHEWLMTGRRSSQRDGGEVAGTTTVATGVGVTTVDVVPRNVDPTTTPITSDTTVNL